ncbi:MMPL family transporter [Rhodococcoides fascians]|uniref:MMPL family transporter n=1 Tax=Rhodococcoides fascians TaxID=1828 RepID=UPI000932DAD7|nr:MMPL family transporter [Rhodococcus fascians]
MTTGTGPVDFVVERARWVLVTVVALVLAAGAWGIGVVDELSLGGYTDPASESAEVDALVESRFGRKVPDVAVVYTPTDGRSIDDIGDTVLGRLDDIDDGLLARTPITYWTVPDAFASGLRSFDGRSALAVLTLTGDEDRRVKTYRDLRAELTIDGATVQFGGFSAIADAYNEQARADLVRAETITFPILLVLLLLIFGGLVAAATPLVIGGMSVVASLAVLRALNEVTEVSVFATNIASLVGLGMAVDYSLFVITRFREELRDGRDPADAVRRTMFTAGRTVAFSALLLVCGFVGMLIFPQSMIRSLGFGGMAAVAVAAVISLTALPAALAILGHRIDSWSWRTGAIDRGDARAQRFWGTVADRVIRRPVLVVVAIVAILALLSAPILGARLGDLDHTGLPSDASAKIATEKLFTEFPLANTGVTVLVESDTDSPPSPAAVAEVTRAVDGSLGVVAAVPGGTVDNLTVVDAIMSSPDRTAGALETLDSIRSIPAPTGTTLRVGGGTAQSQDGMDAIYATLPWMLTIMVLATFVMTTVAFRSIVLSVKAIAMASISLGATFGVLTWIFVDGHGAEWIGVTPGPLQSTMSILIMAVVFGLSTDYEIFLLSRIVEAHDSGATTRDAVRIGAAHTGRVVTAAALLLITVTAFFSLSELTMMRLVGIGIIVGLVIDATIVRMMLVPALVASMGNANWWLRPTPERPQATPRPHSPAEETSRAH